MKTTQQTTGAVFSFPTTQTHAILVEIPYSEHISMILLHNYLPYINNAVDNLTIGLKLSTFYRQ
jgi:hypothetical protein